MNEKQRKLIRVGGPLVRVKMKMKPCQPVDGPITKGPLITVGAPLQRATLQFHEVKRPGLVLKFGVEEGSQPEVVFEKVSRIMALVKCAGFTWERDDSTSEPGRITIVMMPTTAEAAERLPGLKETLTPVLADIREVTKPELTELPVLKV